MATRRNNRKGPRGRTDARTVEPPVPGTSSYSSRYLKDPREFIRVNGIHDRLQEVTINSDRDSTQDRFITEHSLRKIWNGGLLTGLLEVLGYEDNGLAGDVLMNLIKTISILVSIRWDEWRRFGRIFLESRDGAVLRDDRKDRALPHSLQLLEDPSFLGKSWAVDFSRIQSSFLPIIVEQGKIATYPRTRPLPFIRSKRKRIAKGAYGVVTQETIAKYQFLWQNDYNSLVLHKEELVVARKSFPARGDFRKEAQNLARFYGSLSNHTRIVKYLAVITIEDEQDDGAPKEFNILLPLADADLEDFLTKPCYESRCGGISELIKEISNVADAIRWLHGGLRISEKVLICCHMDLKLDNILVYLENPSRSPVGCWKISDFGISSMVERATSEHSPRQPSSTLLSVPTSSPAQSLAHITGTAIFSVHRPPGVYTAPEIEYGNEVKPSSDIWSFGCILYQVLARGAGGIELLKELNDKRRPMENGFTNDHFCQKTASGSFLHPSVSEWLESPYGLLNGNFADRIMVMNCKRLIQTLLQSDPKRRPNAEQLHDKLAQIANGEGETYHFDRDYNPVLPPRSESQPRRPLAGPIHEIGIGILSSSTAQLTPHFQQQINVPAHVNSTPPISPPAGAGNHVVQPNTEQSRDVLPILTPPRHTISPAQVPRRPSIPTSNSPSSPETVGRAFNPGNVISRNRTSNRGSVVSHESQRQPNGQTPPQVRQYYSSQGRDIRQFVNTSPELVQYNTIFDSHGRSRQQSEHTDVPDVQSGPTNHKGEIIPFTTPSHVIMTLISSTRAKIAFVAPKEAVVSTLYSPYSKKTILPPTGYSWEKGSLAGDFLALHGFCSSTSSYVFHLWKLSIDDRRELEIRKLDIQYELPHFEKFAVSRDGRLLLGDSKKVWLYRSFNSRGEELEVGPASSGKLKQVWFSTNGMLLFAWFVLRGNHHHVRVWDVVDTKITGGLVYQVPPSEHSATPLKAMIHFPKAPLCLLWKEHDVVELLQDPKPPSTQPVLNGFHVKNLQAMVVTPNEEAVIFITSSWHGLHHVSKISVARITKLAQGNYRILGDISGEYILTYRFEPPAKCDIVIDEHTSSDTRVKVLIAHSNGNFEVKDVNLPT